MRYFWLFFAAIITGQSVQAQDLEGRLAQGGLVIGTVQPGAQVLLNDKPVLVSDDGRFAIGFGRDAPLTHHLKITKPSGEAVVRSLVLEDRDFPTERVDGLPPKTVTPPPEYYERRKRETGMVRLARDHESQLMHWANGFRLPAKGRISGVYGSQRILNGEPRSPHYGLDVAAAAGTPVVAPAAGIVRLAEPDFLLEGGIIIIDHGFGVSSTLFHLQSVDVKVGESVDQGAIIGAIGATGRANGPHVDWRVNWFDTRIDPALVLPEEPA